MVNGQFTSLQLQLSSTISLTAAPVVQLCVPDAAIGCPMDANWHPMMSSLGSTKNWTATLSDAAQWQRITVTGHHAHQFAGQGEVIRWFQTLGGVGPGHRYGVAPQRDGLLTVDTSTPLSGTQNLVWTMPAVNAVAQAASLPLGFVAAGNPPMDVRILMPGDPLPQDDVIPAPVMLTNYAVCLNQPTVCRPWLAGGAFRTWNAVPVGGCGISQLGYNDIPPGEETVPSDGCGNHTTQKSGPPLNQLLRFDQASGR